MCFNSYIENRMRDILSPILGEIEIDEIDLSIGHNPRMKPGISREFPKEKEGGNTLALRMNRGPIEFPEEKKF